MLALTVEPNHPGSANLEDLAPPTLAREQVLVQALLVGVCGTDREILAGGHGMAPQGRQRLVIGHESLGRVVQAPARSGLKPGELVVGIVRRPDPVPCSMCAGGLWDACENGQYLEHGIRGLDGFCTEYFNLPVDSVVRVPDSLEKIGVLVEPASVVAKAWDQVEALSAVRGKRVRRVLVTGAGPIGLLAAWMGARSGVDVRVLDRIEGGPKAELVRRLGATYHTCSISEVVDGVDTIFECTGSSRLVLDAMRLLPPNGILCLTGISSGRHRVTLDAAALSRELVLENNLVVGAVSANRGHYEQAVHAFGQGDSAWLHALITRRVRLEDWQSAFERRADDVKTVLELA